MAAMVPGSIRACGAWLHSTEDQNPNHHILMLSLFVGLDAGRWRPRSIVGVHYVARMNVDDSLSKMSCEDVSSKTTSNNLLSIDGRVY